MVRSGSCLRLIACGSHSAGADNDNDNDNVLTSENKKSGDKKGWSFRKKSDHPRVLSNTVTTEKESQEPAGVKFQLQDVPVDHVKTSLAQDINEKPVSTVSEQQVTETDVVSIKEAEGDSNPDDSHVILIQTAIRGILAQRELGKLKNVVKLQAAVRGHLVRRHAVGSLRCVQAIVKMQALVRARYARLSLERNHEKDLGKVGLKQNVAGSSIEKVSNTRFARQLMESAAKTKPIRIKCDPLKPNSAWNWLERWVSVSSVEQTERPDSRIKQSERVKSETISSPLDDEAPSEAFGKSAGMKSDSVTARATIVPSGSEENLMTYGTINPKFELCQPASEATDDRKHPHLETSNESNMVETSVELNTVSNQPAKSDADPQTDVSKKPAVEMEPRKRSMKRSASEQLETEGKKFMPGSRKTSNPAFIAAQSKFEELSSVSKSSRSITSSDVTSKPNKDTRKSGFEAFHQAKEFNTGNTETTATSISGFQRGGSECGTELSISSTLDSPECYEVGTVEHCDSTNALKGERGNDDGVSVKTPCTILMPDSSDLVSNQIGDLSCGNDETLNSIELVDSPQVEEQSQKHTSDILLEPGTAIDDQPYRSPEVSPRSHMTVPESQGTPASDMSVKAKKGKKEKSNQKRKSLSVTKASPEKPTPESGVRSSNEQVAKDQKNGKRRDSFGSSAPEHADQEPRDSNSSQSLPRFMQVTESARAKINAGSSPRSSPDMQERDIYVKKRHSLPAANVRQASPRIQRSISQVQQNSKGNERKWQR